MGVKNNLNEYVGFVIDQKIKKHILLILAVMLIICFGIWALAKISNRFNPEDSVVLDPLQTSFNVSYGTDPSQVYDFYTPALQAGKLIILVHGNLAKYDDKSSFDKLASHLQFEDFCVVNMNYRNGADFSFTDALDDIASAVKQAESNREKCNLAKDYELVLAGHSLGANLVTLMGLEETKYGIPEVGKVIGLAGAYDVNAISGQGVENTGVIKDELTATLGTGNIADFSPLDKVPAAEKTVFLFINGDNDNLIQLEQTTAMLNALQSKSCCSRSELVNGRDHYTLITMLTSAGDRTEQLIVDFIRQ